MIIAALGLSSGIIEYTGFGLAVMMAIVTTLAVPPLLQRTLVSGGEQEEILEGSGKGVLTFDMPNKETLMLVLDRVVAQFESEGYYVQRLDVPHAVFRFQLDESTIILRVDHLHLLCSCQIREIPFVRMLFCEVAADLEAIRSHVQSVAYSAVCRNVDAPVADGTSHDRLPLSTAAVEVALSGTTKTEVIDELLQLLVVNGQLPESNVAAARRDVLERESNMSTGMHDGIALPHARTTAIPDVVCAIGIHRTGIDFKSVDGKPSHIFVLTLVPHGYTETYLHLLAEVSQFLSRATNREHVLECETNEQFRNLLRPPDSDE
jgi:mannitol/fructose-specific phosphotransferase system IIA component (Ntr-type)